MVDINRIISLIDNYLETRSLISVEANEMSLYLEKNGALNHSTKGQPLRKLLRAGKIPNAEQPGGKGTSWYIRHSSINYSCNTSKNKQQQPHIVKQMITLSNDIENGLAPIEDSESEILILGTLPGKESLKAQRYYASVNNFFWKILSGVFNKPLLVTNEERKFFLHEHHIALWDVLKSANRITSLDSDIKNPVVNNLKVFVDNHPKLRLICFNGREAYNYFERYIGFKNIPNTIRIASLPSTSSSNTHNTLDEKIRHWKVILE